MKTMHIFGSFIIIVLVGAGIWWYKSFTTYAPNEYVKETSTGTTTVSTTVNATTGSETPTIKSFTALEVAGHKDQASCYTSINNSVYDLTLWVNIHPGGKERILSICGIDGTERFMNKHHGAQKQMTILARYKIGVLTQ